ncbi:MAG: hypothetical protein U0703_11685 [Anaerolineae bacterium]
MQLSLFQETFKPDAEALARCLRADVVALDIETDTRWNGLGPKIDYGLSYPADVIVIALAWDEGGATRTTALAAPFDKVALAFVNTLIGGQALLVAHNAVFDFRGLSKLTGGRIPERIWDTAAMARLLHPAVNASYSLLAVAAALRVPFPESQKAMKGERGRLHRLPLELTLQYAQDDAKLALDIYRKQCQLPADPELIDWECRAAREYCRMAAEGIRLNAPYVERRLAELEAQREPLVARLRADGLHTPGSSKARAEYLYQQKGIPLPRWRESSGMYFTWAGRKRLEANPGAMVELGDLSTRSDVIDRTWRTATRMPTACRIWRRFWKSTG